MYLPLLYCVIFVSENAVKQMREERKQMLQKIIDNDEQWEKAKEEVTQVVAQHSVTQTKLDEQEQLTFMEEQRARVSDNICTCSIYCILLYAAHATVCKENVEMPAALSSVTQCSVSLYRKRLKT